jgi:hypothetical protein
MNQRALNGHTPHKAVTVMYEVNFYSVKSELVGASDSLDDIKRKGKRRVSNASE